MIIIPDGKLNQLPFESLRLQKNGLEYFAIEDYNFSYYYAIEQFLNAQKSNAVENNQILCLAPEFQGPPAESRSCDIASLGKLPFAKEELNYLSTNFEGEFIGSSSTTKADLLDNIKDFPIIHLATHACLNTEDPLLSEIHFSDGYLTNYDIKNLNTRPELVVLSACNTAQGELKEGEGAITLSRGFFEAGVKSLQSSLWALDDYASSQIVKGMYRNLKKGQSKSSSLRQSKLEYLASADKLRSHPYYWAGLIQIGDDNPLFSVFPKGLAIAIGATMLLLILISLLYRKFKSTQ